VVVVVVVVVVSLVGRGVSTTRSAANGRA